MAIRNSKNQSRQLENALSVATDALDLMAFYHSRLALTKSVYGPDKYESELIRLNGIQSNILESLSGSMADCISVIERARANAGRFLDGENHTTALECVADEFTRFSCRIHETPQAPRVDFDYDSRVKQLREEIAMAQAFCQKQTGHNGRKKAPSLKARDCKDVLSFCGGSATERVFVEWLKKRKSDLGNDADMPSYDTWRGWITHT